MINNIKSVFNNMSHYLFNFEDLKATFSEKEKTSREHTWYNPW